MPSRLASPVLSVSITDIAKVDTTNVDNLFTMWTIFSKCADSLEHGRRLENLSWRLWNRETFCCEAVTKAEEEEMDHQGATAGSTIPAVGVKLDGRDSGIYVDMPPLSGSVESVTSDCANSTSPQLDSITNSIHIRPQLIRRDSSRGREKHMTPVHLAKLVDGMKFDDILTTLRAQSAPPQKTQMVLATAPVQTSAPQPPTATSTHPSPAAEEETHSIVRGFSPAHISSSIRSQKAQVEESKTKMWIIGSASSDGSASLEEVYRTEAPRKRTSFKEEVVSQTVYDDDDDEYTTEEEVDESAIDDDESDWDSVSDSISSSYEQRNMFQRLEELAQPALPSRPSLLSTLLGEPNRATALAHAGLRTPALRSRTTSPQGPSVAPSPSKDSPISFLGGLKIKARPTLTTTSIHPPALSPRTTRRNMLATELTESLRQNLLWERKQQVTTAQAVLKRRHTTHTEMSKLAEYPQLNHMSKDASKNNSWNHFFDGLNEYHTKGW